MSPLTPIPSFAPIPRRALAKIGLIMLQGATIEHLVTMALIKLLKMDIFCGLLALKGLSLSAKLNKLQYLVEAEADLGLAERYDELSTLIDKFLNCRNSLAHASYAFQNTFDYKEADYNFSDISDLGLEGSQFSTKFAIFSLSDLKMCTRTGATICFRLSELFGVMPLHTLSPGTVRDTKPPTPRSIRKGGSAKPKPPL